MAKPTLDEILDALLENADFEETESLAKAKAFVTAATRYFILAPSSAAEASSSQTMSPGEIRAAQERARVFIAQNRSGRGSVRVLTTAEGFRR